MLVGAGAGEFFCRVQPGHGPPASAENTYESAVFDALGWKPAGRVLNVSNIARCSHAVTAAVQCCDETCWVAEELEHVR